MVLHIPCDNSDIDNKVVDTVGMYCTDRGRSVVDSNLLYVEIGTEYCVPETSILNCRCSLRDPRRTHSSISLLLADTAGQNPIDVELSVSTAVDL